MFWATIKYKYHGTPYLEEELELTEEGLPVPGSAVPEVDEGRVRIQRGRSKSGGADPDPNPEKKKNPESDPNTTE